MSYRTRIKICGLTRAEDVREAVAAGVDAIGLVFYPNSARYLAPAAAARLMAVVPPFVTTVGLFVNVTAQQLTDVLLQAPVDLLQFHGDESAQQCAYLAATVRRRFIRAMRVQPAMTGHDLIKYRESYEAASPWFAGLLLDTWVDEYGGSGEVFDWSIIPEKFGPGIVLSGGLNVRNATEAVQRVRPFAVDVSSGVEHSKGIKDAQQMRAFIEAIRLGDAIPV